MLHIIVDYKHKGWIYFSKPIPMILIIILCATTKPQVSSNFQYFILIGLFFSLIGDVFLMLRSNQFTKGLLSFLIAHLFYLSAIYFNSGFHFTLIIFSLPFLYFIFIAKYIIAKSGSKMIYVFIYSLVITFLLWQSFEMNNFIGSQKSILFVVGILLFTISDSILAYNKFVKKFSSAQLLILSTYFAAQTLLALSV